MPLQKLLITAVLLLSYLFILPQSGIIGCSKDVNLGTNSEDDDSGDDSDSDSNSGTSPDDDDDDGLSNEVEDTFSIDDRKADSDHDGFADGLEFVGDDGDPLDAGLSPSPFDRDRTLAADQARTGVPDGDQDGLGDTFEEDNSLDPDNPDTDGDGYSDALELIARSDPFLSSSRPTRVAPPAPDGVNRTGAAPRDSDGDGISDAIEPLNATRTNSRDSDTDGFSDGVEFLMGSDPNDASNIPNFSVPLPPDDEDAG